MIDVINVFLAVLARKESCKKLAKLHFRECLAKLLVAAYSCVELLLSLRYNNGQ